MSKPRYKWWSYAKAIIREYPVYSKRLSDLRAMNVTASLSGMPHDTGVSRTTENVALKELEPIEQQEHDAVLCAIESTRRRANGNDTIAIIKMVYWDKTHTLAGAAMVVNRSYDAVKIWHKVFIRRVGANMGFLKTGKERGQ